MKKLLVGIVIVLLVAGGIFWYIHSTGTSVGCKCSSGCNCGVSCQCNEEMFCGSTGCMCGLPEAEKAKGK